MAESAIKIATDPSGIVEAQRLRFQVFNPELNKGLQRSYENGLDVDEFDPFCHHLIVRDVKSNDVVGTYRMMLCFATNTLRLTIAESSRWQVAVLADGRMCQSAATPKRRGFRNCRV